MTICVPKKPFIILSKIIIFLVKISWIPYLILCLTYGFDTKHADWIWFGVSFMWLPFLYFIYATYDYIQSHHLIQWCDEKGLHSTADGSKK